MTITAAAHRILHLLPFSFILSWVASFISGPKFFGNDTPLSDLQLANILSSSGEVLSLISLTLVIIIVRNITSNQDLKYSQLTPREQGPTFPCLYRIRGPQTTCSHQTPIAKSRNPAPKTPKYPAPYLHNRRLKQQPRPRLYDTKGLRSGD